jgi:hypothetical protein
MRSLFSKLLQMGIIASLHDKETFISKVSGVIERYQQNPEQAEKLARSLAEYLQQVNTNINTETSIRNAISGMDFPDNEKVDELTKAIQELTRELRQQKEK